MKELQYMTNTAWLSETASLAEPVQAAELNEPLREPKRGRFRLSRWLRGSSLILLALLLLWYRTPAIVMAGEEDAGTESSEEGGSEDSSDQDASEDGGDSGAGDIEEDNSVALEADKGSATVAEVVEKSEPSSGESGQSSSGSGSSGQESSGSGSSGQESSGSGSSGQESSGSGSSGQESSGSGSSGQESSGSSGSAEQNTIDEPATYENDVPSVTVKETFTSTDTTEAASDEAYEAKISAETATPGEKTYTLTESGDTLREEDKEKVDAQTDKKVTYEQSQPAGEEGKQTVTITRTTVTNSENAIQKAVTDALKKVTENTKYVTITVAAGTYKGDVNIAASDEKGEDGKESVKSILEKNKDFVLYILGEGSYAEAEEGAVIDKTTISAAGGTDVVVKGSLNIDGINTILAGIYFSLDNKQKITGGSDVTIYGTKGKDGISVELEGGGNTLALHAGDGADSLRIATVKPGAGEDGSGGDGASDAFLNIVKAIAGDGTDKVIVNHNGGVLQAEIETGEGADVVTLAAGANAKRSYEDQGDGTQITGRTVNGSFSVDLGAGNDKLTADASLGKAFAAITAEGGAGHNTLTFDGKLKKDGKLNDTDKTPVAGKVEKDSDGIYSGTVKMIGDGSEDKDYVSVNFEQFGSLQDSLENKPTTALDSLNGTQVKSFVNYTYDPSKNTDEKGISADWSAYDNLVLTNLLIEGDEVKLNNINIPAVGLKVKGQDIEVNGSVTANAITVNASDDDITFDLNNAMGSTISSAVGADTLQGSLFDFNATAGITVNKDASLSSKSGAVTLTSAIDQTHKLVDLLGDKLGSLLDYANFFNVKVGEALVRIYGSITSADDVTLSSKANVKMEASNSALAKLYVPLSFVVSVTQTAVEIIGAKIKAIGDVIANAESTASLKAEASTGKVPLSLAVAVAVNDAHVLVGGNSDITADGNVKLGSSASTAAEASAKRGTLAGDVSAYVAAEVAIQEGYANVEDTASITAGRDVDIISATSLKGTASATSAKADTADGGSGDGNGGDATVSSGLGGVKNLLSQIGSKFLESGKTWVFAKLGLAADFVSSKAYKVTAATTDHGSISAPASANGHEPVKTKTFEQGVKYYKLVKGKYVEDTTVKAGDPIPTKEAYYVDSEPVRIVATPDKGYVVDVVTITYLVKGASQKTVVKSTDANNPIGLVKNEDGSFSFKMPDADTSISVTFKQGTSTGETPE